MPEAKTAKQDEPKSQTFNLKPNETQLLVIIHQNQQAVFAATLSNIAQERMGYRVTARTQFKLNNEMSEIEVQELPESEPDVPVNPAEAPAKPTDPEPDASPIVTGS